MCGVDFHVREICPTEGQKERCDGLLGSRSRRKHVRVPDVLHERTTNVRAPHRIRHKPGHETKITLITVCAFMDSCVTLEWKNVGC